MYYLTLPVCFEVALHNQTKQNFGKEHINSHIKLNKSRL